MRWGISGRTLALGILPFALLLVIAAAITLIGERVPDSPHALTLPPYGGYGANAGPKAVHHDGVTYFGWVDGTSGDIQVAAWDHDRGRLEGPATIHAGLEVDMHASPSILVRVSDERLVVAYSRHNGTQMYLAVSAQPRSVAGEWTRSELDSELGGEEYTYPHLMQLTDLASDPIYLVYRSHPGMHPGHAGQTWQYALSRDGGESWSRAVTFYAGDPSGYLIPSQTSGSRVDFVATDGAVQEGTSFEGISTYHFHFDGSGFFRTDGTPISSEPPLDQRDLSLVFDGVGPGVGTYPGHVGLGPDGEPRATLVVIRGERDLEVWRARWDGSRWRSSMVTDGNWMAGSEHPYLPAGHALDVRDASRLFVSVSRGRHMEIAEFRTPDEGSTWTVSEVTQRSTSHQTRPFAPDEAAPDLSVIWQYGPVRSDTDFTVGTAGLRDPRDGPE